MTHSSWKGRSYVRQAVTPTNPNTPTQVSVRAMMAWLNSQWSGPIMNDADRAAWASIASKTSIPPFNAFLADALTNWSQMLAPRVTPTGARANLPSLFSPTVPTVAAETKSALISWTVGTLNFGWGLFIFREPGATITLSRENLVAIVPSGAVGAHTHLDVGLAPGQYAYRFARASTDGRLTITPTTTVLVTIT